MKLDKKYLLNSIEEVLRIASLEECLESLGSENMKVTVAPLSEIIENVGNFGAESRGDGLLNEAWDSYWPEAFNDMRDEIKELTNKGVRAEDLISNIFLRRLSGFISILILSGKDIEICLVLLLMLFLMKILKN